MAGIGIRPVRFVTLKCRILRLGKGGTIELFKRLVLDTEIKIQIKLIHQFEYIDCKLCTLSSVAIESEGAAWIPQGLCSCLFKSCDRGSQSYKHSPHTVGGMLVTHDTMLWCTGLVLTKFFFLLLLDSIYQTKLVNSIIAMVKIIFTDPLTLFTKP